MFALIDCNNFYVSCERVFNPKLHGKPVIVLSNNDACIISRSIEAKKLGIPMGAPFFKWEKICRENAVHIFSSNYELYGDMSERVMTIIKQDVPDIEVYSIDEAFVSIINLKDHYNELKNTQKKIMQCTGIPTSIGFAPTKTVAKIASFIAKNHSNSFVYGLCDFATQNQILASFPVEHIWGIGSQLAKKLKKFNINTAKELRDSDQKKLRHYFSVNVEKIISELRNISCIPLKIKTARDQIITSRSFPNPIFEMNDLQEIIAHHATIAVNKLKQQRSLARKIYVFLETNIFNKNIRQYSNCVAFPFPIPTSDTGYIIRIVKKSIKCIYKQGYQYHKAGVILTDLIPEDRKQFDLFETELNLDPFNQDDGKKNTIPESWETKFDKLSKRYTTSWEELLVI